MPGEHDAHNSQNLMQLGDERYLTEHKTWDTMPAKCVTLKTQ